MKYLFLPFEWWVVLYFLGGFEITLFLLSDGGVLMEQIGDIICRFEKKGFFLKGKQFSCHFADVFLLLISKLEC